MAGGGKSGLFGGPSGLGVLNGKGRQPPTSSSSCPAPAAAAEAAAAAAAAAAAVAASSSAFLFSSSFLAASAASSSSALDQDMRCHIRPGRQNHNQGDIFTHMWIYHPYLPPPTCHV